jgi:hypothetical protein
MGPRVSNEFGLQGPSADGRPARRMNSASRGLRPAVGLRRPRGCLLRRRRPTPGAQRPGRPISIGMKALVRRSACVPNEFGLRRPSASGRPVRRMNSASRGLRPTVGLRRPEKRSLRRRRPTPGAQRLGRPISIGVKASGRRSACVPNEFGLPGPSANGRPAPTGKALFASAKADAWRAAPWKADFNRHEGPRPAVGMRAE